jgi:hypothetical protein
MSSASSSRTRPWPALSDFHAPTGTRTGETCPRDPRGTVSLAVILLFFVFAGLGLAMVHAAGLHLKIGGFRKFSTALDYASENGLKCGLRDFAFRLASSGPLTPLAEDDLEALRADPAGGLTRFLEGALGAPFPLLLSGSLDGMSWDSRASCRLDRLADRGEYFRISAGLRIEASGGLVRVAARRPSALEASLGVLAGRLPLPAIPFYIRKEIADGQSAGFLEESGIRLLSRPGEVLPPAPAAGGEGVVPDDVSPLVAKALNVRLFRPQDLTPGRLREALGLEPAAEPVPDGVYLVRDDLGLGGVFVQGDLEEMVLAISGPAQVVAFRMEAGEWLLEFSPAESRTLFRGPEEERHYDLVPLPIIIVNGKILSLGGGAVGLDGRVEMTFDDRTPSVLDGVDLTIVSSGRITISSHLVMQGVRWQDGLPYVKDSKAQLVIFAAGRDVVSGEARDGGIAVGAEAPSELKLQGSMTAAEGGFSIEGTGRDVQILGALHADDYDGGGNALALIRDERAAAGEFSANSPMTPLPYFVFTSLRVLSWWEY